MAMQLTREQKQTLLARRIQPPDPSAYRQVLEESKKVAELATQAVDQIKQARQGGMAG